MILEAKCRLVCDATVNELALARIWHLICQAVKKNTELISNTGDARDKKS